MNDTDKTREDAIHVLRANDKGGYTVPNHEVYPFQWNWDSLFVALGWMRIDESRAWQEIEMLFRGQWENGLVPSIVFHTQESKYFPGPDIWRAKSKYGIDTTGITQIPMVVPGVELMYRIAKDKALAKKKVQELYKDLFAYQSWFYTERSYKNTGLCQIFHGWESMDNSPMWDIGLSRVTPTHTQYERKDTTHVPFDQRPKQWDYDRYISIVERMRSVDYDSRKYMDIAEMAIVDAAVNGVLLAGNYALRRLAQEFGNASHIEVCDKWISEAEKGMSILWNEEAGIYIDYDVIGDSHIIEPISGGLVPLFGGCKGENTPRYREMLNKWIEQGLPSVDITHEKFDAFRYWRGPSWTVVNFIIYLGAVQAGWTEEARLIKQQSLEQILQSGFYENFNPLTSEGGGGAHFSWTAASYLYWLDDSCPFDYSKIYI